MPAELAPLVGWQCLLVARAVTGWDGKEQEKQAKEGQKMPDKVAQGKVISRGRPTADDEFSRKRAKIGSEASCPADAANEKSKEQSQEQKAKQPNLQAVPAALGVL